MAALWMLTVINAFNLVDVMDGLATTIALCASTGFFIIGACQGKIFLMPVLASMMGALAGFLWFNWPRASIYLGDAGSLFIGGFLAVVSFNFHDAGGPITGYGVPSVILIVPLLEVVTLVVVRSYKGLPFYLPSPDHFSIYLRNNGWSKSAILAYVVFVACLQVPIGLAFATHTCGFMCTAALEVIFLVFWFAILIFGKHILSGAL